ncbi:UbiD family decarboxylase domain-containing protein [Roseibium sp. Sym1]|uniref:UbiD family decarboxylase domain-containing protein n=1 Tax=Roseibium sp. Sym1 TaxID=3016006 RepID=UPI0022B508DC|nr:UbiD family decarboxylase domain-containing protein [Roseibium sp. Sym1]
MVSPPDRAAAGLVEYFRPLVSQHDAGRFFSTGFQQALQKAGGVPLSANRMLIFGRGRPGGWMLPSRRLRALAAAEHENGRSLPVSINIGRPPDTGSCDASREALAKFADELMRICPSSRRLFSSAMKSIWKLTKTSCGL